MSDILKTVKVQSHDPKTQGAFIEINETDYDPKKHKLFEGVTPSGKPPPAAKTDNPPQDGLNWSSNAARDKAIESGLDFSKVKGTGQGGKITVADVDAVIADAAQGNVNFASDEAGELAAELDISAEDLATITGTGTDGAITVEDLEKFVDEKDGE